GRGTGTGLPGLGHGTGSGLPRLGRGTGTGRGLGRVGGAVVAEVGGRRGLRLGGGRAVAGGGRAVAGRTLGECRAGPGRSGRAVDRKSTRLNSSHVKSSYAVFCLKKKK